MAVNVRINGENNDDIAKSIKVYCEARFGIEVVIEGPVDSGIIGALKKEFSDYEVLLGSTLVQTDSAVVQHICNRCLAEKTVIIMDGRCNTDINNILDHYVRWNGNLFRIHNFIPEKD